MNALETYKFIFNVAPQRQEAGDCLCMRSSESHTVNKTEIKAQESDKR